MNKISETSIKNVRGQKKRNSLHIYFSLSLAIINPIIRHICKYSNIRMPKQSKLSSRHFSGSNVRHHDNDSDDDDEEYAAAAADAAAADDDADGVAAVDEQQDEDVNKAQKVWIDLVNSENVRLPVVLNLFEMHGITCIESACSFLTDEIAATIRNSIKKFNQKRFDVLVEQIKIHKNEKVQHESKISEEDLPALDAEMVRTEIQALTKHISFIDSILVGDIDERKMYSKVFAEGVKEKLKESKEAHLKRLEELMNEARSLPGYSRQCMISQAAAVPGNQTQKKSSKQLRVSFHFHPTAPDTTSDRGTIWLLLVLYLLYCFCCA
jgi:hypothetical protein